MALEDRIFVDDTGRQWRASVAISGWVEFYRLDDANESPRDARLPNAGEPAKALNALSETELRQLLRDAPRRA